MFKCASFNINLELFEKYQIIEDCIRCNGKVLEKLKISTVKHEQVYSAEGFQKYMTVIGTKSDAHDTRSKESTRFREPTQKRKPCFQLHLI